MSSHVLAIDEGGTGVRAYVFDHDGREIATAYAEIGLSYPRPGWVEHDPLAIWERTLSVTRTAVEHAAIPTSALAAIGVANQRASALVWDAASGLPIYPAIGWQDLRTVARCEDLGRRGYIVHPLQSATKFAWILEHVPDARARAAAGTLRLGTIDSWISWQLSGGACHVTDASNASCTGIYDFFANRWDEALLDALELPAACLPTIAPTSATCGTSDADLLGARVPLAARAGDQQAAMFGQLCTEPGMMKITYGTAAMMDVNVGPSLRLSPHGAFPLVLWGLEDGVTYCLEPLSPKETDLFNTVEESARMVEEIGVPALRTMIDCSAAGQAEALPVHELMARALIGGISRGTGRAEIARAVLEGIAFRCAEVIEALRADSPNAAIDVLRVDGGASQNDFLMQCQADATGLVIERPVVVDAATLGAAYLAGLATGFWRDRGEVARTWQRERLFEPRTTSDERASAMAKWKKRVALARGEA